MSKQSLLLVDSDTRSLRVLEVSLRKAGFTVIATASVDDALESLDHQAPDLIISETAFTEAQDGFAFRQIVRDSEKWAGIPFVFLTAKTEIEHKIHGLELGVDDYLTKPIYIKEVIARINILLHKRHRAEFDKHKDGMQFSGRLADMPVVDVIQTIEVSRKSGVIHFVAEQQSGAAIYFRDGKVIDAEAGALQGEDAVYRLLTWADGEFEVVFRTVRRRDVIEISSQGLLMEGMRRLDEWSRLLEKLPPLSHRFAVDTGALAAQLGELPDDNNPILRLFDGNRSLLDVINASSLGDLECLQAISRLYFDGLLVDAEHASEGRKHGHREAARNTFATANVAYAESVAGPQVVRTPEKPAPAVAEVAGAPPLQASASGSMRLIEEAVDAAQAHESPSAQGAANRDAGSSAGEVGAANTEARSGARDRESIGAAGPVRVATAEMGPEVGDRESIGDAVPLTGAAEGVRTKTGEFSGDGEPLGAAAPAMEDRESSGDREPLGAAAPAMEDRESSGDAEPVADAAVVEGVETRPDVAAVARLQLAARQVDPRIANARAVIERVAPRDRKARMKSPVEPPVDIRPRDSETPEVRDDTIGDDDSRSVPDSTDAAGLRMIGSYGRERATAVGEVKPRRANSSSGPPQRELITILPRRISRTHEVVAPPAGSELAASGGKKPSPAVGEEKKLPPAAGEEKKPSPAVGEEKKLPPAAGEEKKPSPSPLPGWPTAGHGVRRTAKPAPVIIASILLAVALLVVAIAMHWSRGQRDDGSAVLDAGAPGDNRTQPIATAAPASDALSSDRERATDEGAAVVDSSVSSPGRADAAAVVTNAGSGDVVAAHASAVMAGSGSAGASIPAPKPLDPGVVASDTVNQARALFENAREAFDQGDARKAVALASASLKLRKTARTYLIQSRALQRLGQLDASLESVESALQIVPAYAPAWEQRGLVLWAQGRRPEARLALRRYLELDPVSPDAASLQRMLSSANE